MLFFLKKEIKKKIFLTQPSSIYKSFFHFWEYCFLNMNLYIITTDILPLIINNTSSEY